MADKKEKTTFKRAFLQEGIDAYGRKIRQSVINEVLEDYVDVKLPKKHRFNNGGFITLFQYSITAIAKYGNLNKSELNLLLWLLGTAGIDGSIETNLDVISEELNISKPSVSRSLKGLVERNIVIRKDLRRYDRSPLEMCLSLSYDQINYNLAFNGKTKEFTDKKTSHPAIELQDEENNWINIDTGEISNCEILSSPDIPFNE